MDYDSLLNRLTRYLDSDEGKESINQYFDDILKKNEIRMSQLERLHLNFSDEQKFSEFVDKVVAKYESKEYRYKWQGDAPSGLYYFLYDYAVNYGREANEDEYSEYAHEFTDNIFFIHGYYFMHYSGQGSFVDVFKATKNSP